jgi:hypothetical protein
MMNCSTAISKFPDGHSLLVCVCEYKFELYCFISRLSTITLPRTEMTLNLRNEVEPPRHVHDPHIIGRLTSEAQREHGPF